MDITLGNIQMVRTNPAHAGTAPLTDISKSLFTDRNGSVHDSPVTEEKQKGTFETYLLEAVNGVNQKQLDVSSLQEKIITDPDSVDIHDVTTAMAKAQMSLNLAQTVIDRLVSGWTELSQNR